MPFKYCYMLVRCKLTVMLYVSKLPVPVSGSSAWTVITGEFTGVSCINIILLNQGSYRQICVKIQGLFKDF